MLNRFKKELAFLFNGVECPKYSQSLTDSEVCYDYDYKRITIDYLRAPTDKRCGQPDDVGKTDGSGKLVTRGKWIYTFRQRFISAIDLQRDGPA